MANTRRVASGARVSLGQWICARCLVLTAVLALTGPPSLAQTWQADVPRGIGDRETAVVVTLSQRLASARFPVRIEVASQRSVVPQALSQVEAGRAQLTIVPITALVEGSPEFAVFESIFLFKNLAAVDQYTSSSNGRRLLDSLRTRGLRGLAFLDGGMVQIVSSQPLRAAELPRGLKLGSSAGTQSYMRQFEALGLSPVRVSNAEAVAAVERGVVDAVEAGWPELSQAAKPNLFILESNHRYRGYVVLANNSAFERLPGAAQEQLLAAARAAAAEHNAMVQATENVARERALRDTRTPAAMSRADYDALYAKLTRDGWAANRSRDRDLRPHFANALSFSDRALANKYYATASARPPDLDPIAQPVYNADLSPQLERAADAPNRPVLEAGRPATLRFDIGPRWTTSVLPPMTPSPDIVNSKEDVPLTVVLACGFCEPQAESLKRMLYRANERQANEVRFQFTPEARPGGVGYGGRLQLAVINDKTGREFDRLSIDVSVAGTAPAAAGGSTSRPLVSRPVPAFAGSNWQPDVVLHANQVSASNVSLEFEPISEEMKQRLGPLALDAQGQRRTFRSGIDDADLVGAMTKNAYGVMSALSKQGEFLERLSATGTDASVSPESQESLQLSPTESANVSGVIANIGKRLYRNLFVSPDRNLGMLVEELEKAAAEKDRARPIRLQIVTSKLSLPWQYLHPPGAEVDPNRLWGLAFSLNVLRVNTNAPDMPLADSKQARKVVFARYGSSADPTVPLAKEQKAQLLQLPGADSDLIEVDSGSVLLDNLKQQRNEISAIVTFLHANAAGSDAEAQLLFNDGDRVTADRLEDLLNELTMAELSSIRYLAGAPLVILNACETGPSVNLPYVTLGNAMFKLGAQGVVTTEVSVWIHLGHEMATRLVTRLGKGEVISEALTAVRRDLYAEKKNPLGVLYSYYGDPTATLRH